MAVGLVWGLWINTVFNLPMVVSEDGEIDQTLIVEVASGRTRARQGCFAEAENSGLYQYFLVIEGRSSRKTL